MSKHILLKRIFQAVIHFYQSLLSPYLGSHCRFAPSCSQYASGAIEKHGLLKSLVKIFLRLARCHPFHPGGYDPVSQ